jgi:murein DD-endopeptidase MepM/ murein hydrolase activator NlpD
MRIVAIALLVWSVAPARAEVPFDLLLPLDCRPGIDCWILRYMDHDSGPGVRDYACGKLTGNGHKGTDFAISNLAVMAEGVEVRAAAPGIVDGLRDGMPDQALEESGREAVGGKECGNGIRLDHGNGWTSWYCHLRRGSLMVAQGDRVIAGQPIALVGLSGETTFPHLHFDIRRDGAAVDPFVGRDAGQSCGVGERPLWSAQVLGQLDYAAPLITNIGIAAAAPEKEDVRRGWHQRDTLSTASPALVVFVEANWLSAGDRVTFRLRAPEGGAVVERTMALERDQQRWFGFAGAKRPGERWPPGRYAGEVALETAAPGGKVQVVAERSVELR